MELTKNKPNPFLHVRIINIFMTCGYFLFIKILIFNFFFPQNRVSSLGRNIKKGSGGTEIEALGTGFISPWLWLKAAAVLPKGSPLPSHHPLVRFPPTAGVALMCSSHYLWGCQWGGVAFAHSGKLFNHSLVMTSWDHILRRYLDETQHQLLGELNEVSYEL